MQLNVWKEQENTRNLAVSDWTACGIAAFVFQVHEVRLKSS